VSKAGLPGAGWMLALVVLGAGAVLVLLSEGAPAPIGRGSPAPDFELPLLDGPSKLSLEKFRGQVVLLNFWATWCKPCEDEMPAMERLYRSLRGQDFELVAVTVDEEKDEGVVREFRERMAISFPIALDPRKSVSELYQTMGFPESLLIDRDGRVVERYVGPRDWDHRVYAERIRALLGGP
jgi:cytochrome c biogenesis protein CcmG/thiol:disulfide interchange protein DsbE